MSHCLNCTEPCSGQQKSLTTGLSIRACRLSFKLTAGKVILSVYQPRIVTFSLGYCKVGSPSYCIGDVISRVAIATVVNLMLSFSL